MVTQNDAKSYSFSPDPYSNTGSDSQGRAQSDIQGRIDWIQGIIDYTDVSWLTEIESALNRHLNQPGLLTLGKSIKFFENSGRWECGAMIGWNAPTENEPGKIYISIPGKGIHQLLKNGEYRNLWELMNLLDSVYNFKCTRIDIARDDYGMNIPFKKIDEAILAGNYSGFQKAKHIGDYKEGKTIYCGSKESDTFVRIYNKDAESKGLVKSHRIERVFKDTLAEQVFNQIMQIVPDDYDLILSPVLCNIAIGKLDFIDRSVNKNEKNLNRFPQLEWWKEYIEGTIPIGYSRPKVVHNLNRKMTWINRSVARSLAMVKKTIGAGQYHNWLNKLIKWAEENLSAEQENYVQAWTMDSTLQVCYT